MNGGEAVSLDLLDRAMIQKRARLVAIVAVVVALVLGGMVCLFSVPIGAAVACVVAVPVLLVVYGETRKSFSLDGTRVSSRGFRTRSVELSTAESLDVLVTNLRGVRTVSLLAKAPGNGRAVSVALAMYKDMEQGTGGRELGVYELRRVADALASTPDTHGLVLSELIVAQLKAEARGDGAGSRPLYRIGTLAQQGQVAQRLYPDTVTKFVAALD